MVKLKDIYDNVQNPLNDKKFVEKIILAYSKSNRTDVRDSSDLYDFFVHSKKIRTKVVLTEKTKKSFMLKRIMTGLKLS